MGTAGHAFLLLYNTVPPAHRPCWPTLLLEPDRVAYEGQDKAGAAVAMRRTGRARARTVLLGALVLGVLCLPGCVDAHASYFTSRCSVSLTEGSAMGFPKARSTAQQIKLARSGSVIPCGGTLTPGETGLTLFKSSTPTFGRVPSAAGKLRREHPPHARCGRCAAIEAEMSAGTGSWGIISGSCSMTRTLRCGRAWACMHRTYALEYRGL